MISFKTQQKWKLVDQIFQNGSLCEGCVYLDRRVGEGVQCALLEDHMGQLSIAHSLKMQLWNKRDNNEYFLFTSKPC